jgi:hypothetical protein
MRIGALAGVATLCLATAAAAQSRQFPNPEIRPMIGAYVPTGAQADFFESALSLGAQGGFELNKWTTFVGSFAWSPSRIKVTALDDRVNTYTYDVGVELAMTHRLQEWDFKPFIGGGIGGKSYDYADATLPGKSLFLGYGALGTELQFGRTALRAEVRDYVSDFTAPTSGATSSTRNELTFAVGFALHLW